MYSNILIAVDGSDHARKAARSAGELAFLTGAVLWLVHAYEPVPVYLGEPNLQEALNERLLQSEAVVQAAKAELGVANGEIHTEVLEGPAAEAILSVAKTRGIDLIVMGTRGLSSLSGLLLGSQSQKVVAQADCPVLLVR